MEGNKKDIEKMHELKQAYKKPEMSGEQLARMKERMEEAKMEKRDKKKENQNKKKENRNKKNRILRNTAAAAAAAAIVFVALPNTSESVAYAMSSIPVVGKLVEAVTFRDYKYESERNSADIEVPELAVNETGESAGTEQLTEGTEQAAGNPGVQENLKKTTEEINAEIQKITDEIVAEFEENLKSEGGYQSVVVKHEVLSTTENYFTLKLICYQGAGSGAEWDYFYTIDLTTGERLALKDLFTDGADYITPISENIKEQMKEQMDADENVIYWLDNEDIPEWNFEKITDETSFYLNDDGNVVICFNEGDVAPMYMGCVEFVIPEEVLEGIRK